MASSIHRPQTVGSRPVLSLLALIAVLAAWEPALARQQEPIPQPNPQMACMIRARDIAMAVQIRSQETGGKLPADLFSLLPYVTAPKDGGSIFISPAHAGLIQAPKDLTADWVNTRSSYVYLGGEDIALDAIPDPSTTVLIHQRLEAGHKVEPTPDNPEGEVFSVAFLDGHIEGLSRAAAERAIHQTERTFDALRTGKELPEDQQSIDDVRTILRAIYAYAHAHDGVLPPDLGATLEFIPKEPRLKTPAARAGVFLSPKARKATAIPETPTAEWVNTKTSYVYLGGSKLTLRAIPEPDTVILVHGKVDQPLTVPAVGGHDVACVVLGAAGGRSELRSQPYAKWIVRESRQVFDALAGAEGAHLPDWIEASRDARLLGLAINHYAREHDNHLPPDLGSVLEHVPLMAGITDIRSRAGVFLAPRVQRVIDIPAQPTAEWVNQHATFTYLGNASVTLPAEGFFMTERGSAVIFCYAGPEDIYTVMLPAGRIQALEERLIPFTDAMGLWHLAPNDWLKREVEASRKAMESPAK